MPNSWVFILLPWLYCIDAFELWCWRRLLRVPCTARRSNQSILKEISSEYSLEGLMLKLKLQYFGHLMWRTDSLEKTLMVGKIEGRRRRGWQRMSGQMASPMSSTLVSVSSGSWWWTGRPGVLQSTGSQTVGHNWVTKVNWIEIILIIKIFFTVFLFMGQIPGIHPGIKIYLGFVLIYMLNKRYL